MHLIIKRLQPTVMQGIPFFDFKVLHKQLEETIEAAEKTGCSEDLELANHYKKILSELYVQYSKSLQDISEHTKRFSNVKLNVRKLLTRQKRKLKQASRKLAIITG